jgi:hypothetical protein
VCEQAQAHAGEYELPGSATAFHADISSASIPAVSFVMTANTPVCSYQRNQTNSSIPAVRSDLPIAAVKAGSNGGAIHFRALLQIIRNWKKEAGGGG